MAANLPVLLVRRIGATATEYSMYEAYGVRSTYHQYIQSLLVRAVRVPDKWAGHEHFSEGGVIIHASARSTEYMRQAPTLSLRVNHIGVKKQTSHDWATNITFLHVIRRRCSRSTSRHRI